MRCSSGCFKDPTLSNISAIVKYIIVISNMHSNVTINDTSLHESQASYPQLMIPVSRSTKITSLHSQSHT